MKIEIDIQMAKRVLAAFQIARDDLDVAQNRCADGLCSVDAIQGPVKVEGILREIYHMIQDAPK